MPEIETGAIGLPKWAESALRYGGGVGVLVAAWFMFLSPMKQDFGDFKRDVTDEIRGLRKDTAQKLDRVAAELTGINRMISEDLRERITKNETRDESIMRRLDALEADRRKR